MSVDTLRIICEGLNAEPFLQNLTPVKLDSQTPEKLLQNLSDVVQWVQRLPFVDVRGENPDETTIRILNALRVFRYPPPRDIDQIQKWRLDILEGQKSTIYSILQWIFENIDRLRERVYLAKYLTRIEIPPDAQSVEVARVESLVSEKMEEFKLIHSQIIESRGEFLRAEDVRADLVAMEEEKEQLLRKIERSRRKLARLPDLEKHLETAARFHAETEKHEELQLQHQEQHNALLHASQRVTRLEKALADVEREQDLTDPQSVISKLRSEVEVSGYVLNEKLTSDIMTQKSNIESIRKILSMRNVDKSDIVQLQAKVEQLNSDIINIQVQQSKSSENDEDKLTIYRHQAANVQRKKANVADSLQNIRQELDSIETTLTKKRKELMEKSGKEEIVTSIQFKAYMKKLRNKNTHYKRKKGELEQAKAEIQILERTVELLAQRIEKLRKQCEIEGRNFTENIPEDRTGDAMAARPKTAKPSTTNINELTEMAERLNVQLSEKRDNVHRINGNIEEFYNAHREQNENFYSRQRDADALRLRIENEQKWLKKEVLELESMITTKQKEFDKSNGTLAKLEWFSEKLDSTNQIDSIFKDLERQNNECTKAINEFTKQLEQLQRDGEAPNQLAMWKSLLKIFQLKINLYHQYRSDSEKPIGDNLRL